MELKRDDILCLDDLKFYHLEHKGYFGNSKMYSNGIQGLLLDPITEHTEEPLFKIGFIYNAKPEYYILGEPKNDNNV